MKKLSITSVVPYMTISAALFLITAHETARADPINLVQNGDFEETLLNRSSEFGTRYPSQQVTDWTSTGFSTVFLPGTADTSGALSTWGTYYLWGPGRGSNNGLTTSPTGGNFIAADGDVQVAPISQTINGLTVGQAYNVSFYWAGSQVSAYGGTTTESWHVSLGNETLSTPTVSNAYKGFTGWMADTLTFTATSTSEVLSFVAQGGPSGLPPMVLLDGVTMTAVDSGNTSSVPEPAPWSILLGGGLLLCIGQHRLRYKASSSLPLTAA